MPKLVLRLSLIDLAGPPHETADAYPHVLARHAASVAGDEYIPDDLHAIAREPGPGCQALILGSTAVRMDIGHGPDKYVPVDWLVLIAASV